MDDKTDTSLPLASDEQWMKGRDELLAEIERRLSNPTPAERAHSAQMWNEIQEARRQKKM